MATPEDRARQQAAQDVAAGAAAAAGTHTATAAAVAAAQALTAEQVARATSQIMLSFVRFLAALTVATAVFLRRTLSRRTTDTDLIEELVREEQERGREFDRRSAERLQRDLPRVLAIPDSKLRRAAVAGVLNRERRYAHMRSEAMTARAVATLERRELKAESPQGAFWLLDPEVKEHTAGCLIMGGKFWPWEVLDRVHPPRHPACPCRLISYGRAVALGLLAPGAIMEPRVAVELAAGVVMEAEDAAAARAEIAAAN